MPEWPLNFNSKYVFVDYGLWRYFSPATSQQVNRRQASERAQERRAQVLKGRYNLPCPCRISRSRLNPIFYVIHIIGMVHAGYDPSY